MILVSRLLVSVAGSMRFLIEGETYLDGVMNLYFRFLLLLLKRIVVRKPIDLFSACTTRFRVNPFDLDLNFHMNNGRYLTIMDLGRFDLLLKSKTFWPLTGQGYYPVVSSEAIRFRKSLKVFASFDLVTTLEAWDEKDFYISQKFVQRGQVVAEGMIKGRFLQRGRRGSVPNAELFEAIGAAYPSGHVNQRAQLLKEMESNLAAKKKADT